LVVKQYCVRLVIARLLVQLLIGTLPGNNSGQVVRTRVCHQAV